MAPEESDFIAALNQALCRTAGEIGAHSVSVLVINKDQSVRRLYDWPGSPESKPAEFPRREGLPSEWRNDWVAAESELGHFLNRGGAPAGAFFLVRCSEPCWNAALAFGFGSAGREVRISSQLSITLHLAALAAWEAEEILRLRRDLRVVAERLGHRKNVERAKGLLQVRHGWTEQQAYEHLRKLSRQRRKSMADTAQDLLRIPRGT